MIGGVAVLSLQILYIEAILIATPHCSPKEHQCEVTVLFDTMCIEAHKDNNRSNSVSDKVLSQSSLFWNLELSAVGWRGGGGYV
jgi:hypothetical protein